MDGSVAAPAGDETRPVCKPSTGKVRRVKTFTGCWGCRSRKVKCDETFPECKKCCELGTVCQGYRPAYVWVTPNKKTYDPGRRRVLETYLTWRGHPTWDSAGIDGLITHCDVKGEDAQDHGEIYPVGYEKSAGPFGVFACHSHDRAAELGPGDHVPLLSEPTMAMVLFDRSAYLLDHYTKYIALNMMPFKDFRNPWQTFYPLIASHGDTEAHRSLFHAILAQAAGNLACLGSETLEMVRLSVYHNNQAIQRLRNILKNEEKDFGTIVATVLTLIMAEVYSGSSASWRQHLKGGWEFLKCYQVNQPWLESDFAWMATQSLCLLKIRTDTMSVSTGSSQNTPSRGLDDDVEESLISSVATRHDFGFTVGANQTFIMHIKDITDLKAQLQSIFHTPSIEQSIRCLHQRLSNSFSNTAERGSDPIVECHHRIFYAGIMIYFYRSIWNLPPLQISEYLRVIFDQVLLYQSLGGPHITLWPIFIAAMESYEETHLAVLRAWLDTEDQIGIANRRDIRAFTERVWIVRRETAEELKLDKGEVLIDWATLMQEWNMGYITCLVSQILEDFAGRRSTARRGLS